VEPLVILIMSYVIIIVHTIVTSDILHGEPLELDIQGLEYMNDDPDEVDVLYAMVCPVDGSQRYHSFCLYASLFLSFVDCSLYLE